VYVNGFAIREDVGAGWGLTGAEERRWGRTRKIGEMLKNLHISGMELTMSSLAEAGVKGGQEHITSDEQNAEEKALSLQNRLQNKWRQYQTDRLDIQEISLGSCAAYPIKTSLREMAATAALATNWG
jgi:hypothetical protein